MNGRGAPNGLRGNIAAGSFDAVREHHSSINLLIEHCLYGSAFALLRPMFDGCIVGLWATYLATDELLERFEAGRFTLSPQKVITQLKSRDDGSYTDTLQRIYDQAWKPLSSYVRFPPLFGQVFSDNKLVNLGLVSSCRTGFFSRCCFPQKATGRRGCDFQPCACSQRRTRIGYTGRSFVNPYPKLPPGLPEVHLRWGLSAQVVSAGCVIERNVAIQPLPGLRSIGVVP